MGPEKAPIRPEKARFSRKDFCPIFSENLGLKPGGATGSSSSVKHVTFPKDTRPEVIGRPAREHKRERKATE